MRFLRWGGYWDAQPGKRGAIELRFRWHYVAFGFGISSTDMHIDFYPLHLWVSWERGYAA